VSARQIEGPRAAVDRVRAGGPAGQSGPRAVHPADHIYSDDR